MDAAQGVFNREELGNITAIEVVHNGENIKLGLTREERQAKVREEELAKELAKKTKR